MSENTFFPARPETRPAIYAYEDTNSQYAGLLKIGYNDAGCSGTVAEQYPVATGKAAV